MRALPSRLVLLLAALLALPAGLFAAPLAAEPHYSQIARRVAMYLPSEHLKRTPLDDRLSVQAWTNYIGSASGLDPDRLYFLKTDLDRFRADRLQLDDEIEAGDLSFAYEVYDVFRQRVTNRCAYVESLLKKGFDFNRDESYAWKREDVGWPATEKEWNELWRRKVKSELLRYVVADEEKESDDEEDLPPPAERVRKRYDRFRSMVMDSDAEWVLQKYLSAVAHAYDPHSSYMSPSTVEDFNIEMKLSLVGIGALLQTDEGAAKVLRIIPGGPADRDGRLQPGDRIIAVAQEGEKAVDVMHWPLTKVVDLIRGEKDTQVTLTVIPAVDPSGARTRKVPIVRGEVRLEEQAASSSIHVKKGVDGKEHKLAVINLPAFYANMKVRERENPEFKSASYDVRKLLRSVNRDGVEGIALDLRNNGGGSLLEAVQMVGLFIRRGPVVQVKERITPRVLADDDPLVSYSGPMVVLVSRLSASASEIVAGALQDYGRAIVVGDRKTHGKGTVQSILELGQEKMGALKLTTSVYYRISGASTQLRGVESDIVIRSPFDTMEYGEDYLKNAMPWDTEDPAIYRTVPNLRQHLPRLKQLAAERQKKNPDFATYLELLSRIEAINSIEALPLEMEARRKLAKTEKELLELRDKLVFRATPAPGEEKKPDAEKPDLVLGEALNILADLVALEGTGTDLVPPSPPASRVSLPDSISDWFRRKKN